VGELVPAAQEGIGSEPEYKLKDMRPGDGGDSVTSDAARKSSQVSRGCGQRQISDGLGKQVNVATVLICETLDCFE
jgi:hypothetical protein